MGLKNHSETTRIHKDINLGFADEANRIAGTNEIHSIVLSADNEGQLAYVVDTATVWRLKEFATLSWERVLGLDSLGVRVWSGMRLTRCIDPISLDDGISYALPDATAGFGYLIVGDNEERARFSWNSSGVVVLDIESTNVVNADTPAKFCIFGSGTTVNIKNRLGSTKTVTGELTYTPNP